MLMRSRSDLPVCCQGMAKKTKHSPARRRDTAEEFSTIYEVSLHASIYIRSILFCFVVS